MCDSNVFQELNEHCSYKNMNRPSERERKRIK